MGNNIIQQQTGAGNKAEVRMDSCAASPKVQEDKRVKSWAVAAIVLFSVLLLVNIYTLCRCCPRPEARGLDYMGVIVGALALIVTVLIGWQLYNAIRVDAIKMNLSKEKNRILAEMSSERSKNADAMRKMIDEQSNIEVARHASLLAEIGNVYRRMGCASKSGDGHYLYLCLRLLAFNAYIEAERYAESDAMKDDVGVYVKDNDVVLTEDQKLQLMVLLYRSASKLEASEESAQFVRLKMSIEGIDVCL